MGGREGDETFGFNGDFKVVEGGRVRDGSADALVANAAEVLAGE